MMPFMSGKVLRLFQAILLVVTCGFLGFEAQAESTVIEKVRSYREGDVFTSELLMKGTWSGSEAQALFTKDGIHFDFPGTVLAKNKHIIRVEDRVVKSVVVTQATDSVVRASLNIKAGLIPKSLANHIRMRKSGSSLVIEVLGDAGAGSLAKGEADVMRVFSVLDETGADEALPAKLVADVAPTAPAEVVAAASVAVVPEARLETASAPSTPTSEEIAKLPENQIPVLTNTKEVKKASGNQVYRLLITLGVLIVALGGVLFGLKRWGAKKGSQKEGARIKVLTQHHLGPKKSLAIVQVAGESILVGITDHNISMLKSLSLLDEEIPESVPRSFNGALASFGIDEDTDRNMSRDMSRDMDQDGDEASAGEDFAMRGLAEIRDTVAGRLKNMRRL